MAIWCAVTGFPPDVYKQLSLVELQAFFDESKKVKGLK